VTGVHTCLCCTGMKNDHRPRPASAPISPQPRDLRGSRVITLHSVSKELGKGWHKKLVLEDVNWTIPPRSHILILGQRGSGKSTLLNLVAGMALPTLGWIDRRAMVSVPGGVLRYGTHVTPRKLVLTLSQVYKVDPHEIIEFIARSRTISDVLDVPVRALRGALRSQLNLTLTYAFPCDFYVFDGSISVGRDPEFRKSCAAWFQMRRKQAGTLIATHSVKVARVLGGAAAGGFLFRNKLYLYPSLEEAITSFERLPKEEILPDPNFLPEKEEDLDGEEAL
jgi:capsular polysaccharide transport system ATP-binding protein